MRCSDGVASGRVPRGGPLRQATDNDGPGTLAVVFWSAAGYRRQSVNSRFEAVISGLGAIPGEDGPILVVATLHRKGFLGTSGETQVLMTTAE